MGQVRGKNGRPVPIHRLRPNEKEWSPPSVVVVDTETRARMAGTVEEHRMRLWCAVHVDRRQVKKTQGQVSWEWGETPASFASWLDGRTRGRNCVWVYAHNLNFDMVVADIPRRMVALGWEVSEFSVGGQAPWLRLRKGSARLTVVDSWSWLPQSLESLAATMGRAKEPLPAPDDGIPAWLTRCGVDVELTARCVLALMDWWDARRLGRWTITGAGCGWNAMRHIPTEYPHVIDPDPELVALDRLAVRGGRRDAARIGAGSGGPWVELDLTAAYPTVCRELPLPVRRGPGFDRLDIDHPVLDRDGYGVIADCRIRTERPVYPVTAAGVTWFPVGEFVTCLAGPELLAAREAGELVSIGAGQTHRLGMTLQNWATWVLDPSDGGRVEVPPVGYVAAKAWSRSVVGKFASRSHTTQLLEGDTPDGWSTVDSWDAVAGRRAGEVSIAGRSWYVTYDLDAENAYPAVLAWVESEVRLRLGRVLRALDGAWWTCDTDGLIVDVAVLREWLRWGTIRLGCQPRDPLGLAQSLCDWLAPLVAPLTLRPKRLLDGLTVLGPQHLTAGAMRRMSGVRGDAVETEPGRFVSRDWPKLKWQINNSAPGVYLRPERTSTFTAPTVHRWVLADGTAMPVRMEVTPEGVNRILPWSQTAGAGELVDLAEVQYRGLRKLCG